MSKTIGIGLMGLGTVGYGVFSLIKEELSSLFQVEKILIKEREKRRPVEERLLTTVPGDLINNPQIQIIIEVIGGIEPAREYITQALKERKHVVTANKLLLANHGEELLYLAQEEAVALLFEASVCGGIPILRTIKDSLSFHSINEISGIMNGTTNYILSAMTREGLPFQDSLKKAMDLGYAEADPTSDISGEDAACKLAILSSLAFGQPISLESVPYEGISRIEPIDLEMAKEMGYRIKLLASAEKREEGLSLHVGSYLLKEDHPLAQTEGVHNHLLIKGEHVGELFFAGPGAGMYPTAHSIISDIMSIYHNTWSLMSLWNNSDLSLLPIEDEPSSFYLRFEETDSSLLHEIEEHLPIECPCMGPKGIGIITKEVTLSHLTSLLSSKDMKRPTLYRVKGDKDQCGQV